MDYEVHVSTSENSNDDPGGGTGVGYDSDGPVHLTIEPFDFVIFNDSKDEEEAEKFCKELLEKAESNGLNINGCLFKDLEMPDDREFDYAEKICSRAVQKWFFVTENFLTSKTMLLHKDEHLMNAIIKGSTFIPIWNKPKSQFKDLPYGLRAYTGLHTDDHRMIRKLKILFDNEDHRMAKLKLKDKADLIAWRKDELERKRKEEEYRKQKWKAREEDMEEEVNTAVQNEPLTNIQHQVRVTEQILSGLPEWFKKLQENPEMPAYLLQSLARARNVLPMTDDARNPSTSPRRNSEHGGNETINITINQPQNVLINKMTT